MTSFEAGDIVAVDYPHVETKRLKRRPSLVVSCSALGPDLVVFWGMMITSAVNRGWPGDLVVADHLKVGLPIASVIRTEKITTLECKGAEKIGRISDALLADVRARMVGYLGEGKR
jgi:mRNA interferase MazF